MMVREPGAESARIRVVRPSPQFPAVYSGVGAEISLFGCSPHEPIPRGGWGDPRLNSLPKSSIFRGFWATTASRMGWLKWNGNLWPQTIPDHGMNVRTAQDDHLPFIPGDAVRAARTDPNRLWIVVDNIVYDCTEFVHIHPGGNTVIESFNGEDCSWQFWRFHSRSVMDTHGRSLRIGRTAGVANRFNEKPRFYGLRRLGADEE